MYVVSAPMDQGAPVDRDPAQLAEPRQVDHPDRRLADLAGDPDHQSVPPAIGVTGSSAVEAARIA